MSGDCYQLFGCYKLEFVQRRKRPKQEGEKLTTDPWKVPGFSLISFSKWRMNF